MITVPCQPGATPDPPAYPTFMITEDPRLYVARILRDHGIPGEGG
jgi:hypothetical protein